MIRARNNPDGLPFRVYERFGSRVYSIGYKMRSGRWAYRYRCPVDDANQVRKLRRQAIEESTRIQDDVPEGGFSGLVEAWFAMQEALPDTAGNKRATSTLDENRNEAKMLLKAFGHLEVAEVTRPMGYQYLAGERSRRPTDQGQQGNRPRPADPRIRGPQGDDRERTRSTGVTQNKKVEQTAKRYVTRRRDGRWYSGDWSHVGGPYLRHHRPGAEDSMAVRPPVVRGPRRSPATAITDTGIVWTDSKDVRKNKPKILIEWSPELRRNDRRGSVQSSATSLAGSFLLFGNLKGQRTRRRDGASCWARSWRCGRAGDCDGNAVRALQLAGLPAQGRERQAQPRRHRHTRQRPSTRTGR
jgi:hypothetical protein